MRGFGFASTVLATASFFTSSVLAQSGSVDPLVIKGSKFFYKTNGTQFFIRGVAYQQDAGGNGTVSTGGSNSYTDPLADATACARDIPYLTQLMTNVIRVYAIDPTKDHSECMSMLANAGIYVISDLSSPGQSINSDAPAWNDDLYNRYTSVVDALQNYTNVMGFFAGNEVSNAPNNTAASAFVKAAVRDIKGYIAQKKYRTIGVGYATADVSQIRVQLADYLNCGDQSTSIDFWGYNIYSWCGDSTYETSGYQARTQEFSNYSVPSFFAEYGCNTQGTRTFQEVGTLYGKDMSQVFSGGIVYMYFQETNNYGLVSVDGTSTPSKMPDFTNLQTALAKVSPSSVESNSYNPTNTALQACPTLDSNWDAPASPLPPVPNEDLCSCMQQSLSCVIKSSVSTDDYQDLFSYICGQDKNACAGINTNGTLNPDKPSYGAYAMCNSTQQLNWAINQYASSQKSNSNACDFSGSASSQQAVATPSGSCSALLQQAASGTGTVTSSPTSGGGSSSSTSSGAASAMVNVPNFNFGLLNLSIYIAFAAISGAAMILL
ncbi:carbohydrate-binding module family 43 protein [Viridothelium virens]|uniref:1,3-beta-glucanosyltransferase n=1 Tax=Viridothelium virens TaxID=1048519 RepID=A0A6A6HNJ0_VIRVR|nr:carbohydrate-binding module family 43 protein [Viridothelium virens]